MAESSTTKSIYLEVRFAILQGAYRPGQILDRNELCLVYGCKSAIVVDALNVLVHEGYLDIPKRGVFGVRTWSTVEVNDLFDIRATMMAMAAARAAERRTDLEVGILGRALEFAAPFDYSDADATERFITSCAGLQNMVVQMARVSTISEIARSMGPNALFRKSVWSQNPRQLNNMWKRMAQTCQAIAHRDTNDAHVRMTEFVEATRAPLLVSLKTLPSAAWPEFPAISRINCSITVNDCRYGPGDREVGLDGRTIPFGAHQSRQ